MASLDAFVATTRFGMGAAAGELSAAAGDPRGWVAAQLRPQPMPALLAGLPSGVECYGAFRQAELDRRQLKQQAAAAPGDAVPPDPGAARLRDIYVGEAAARTRAGVASDTPVVERLVRFWSNHFTVSIARPVVAPTVGAFEREAIRPYVFGRFLDMLRAVATHPAMLVYLDNAVSVGPDSPAGIASGRGINENFAREVMELHTLGVDGGYTQQDVTELARILTGWSLAGLREPGGFVWRPRVHEPGDKRLLGTVIRSGGIDEGEQALAMLAGHPATARHVATQLVRHFVADDPPAAAVAAVARSFQDSDGDLAEVTRTLVSRPEGWDARLAKAKSPDDFLVSLLRATGDASLDDKALVQSLRLLGQMPFAAEQPAGWPDDSASWIGPDALMRRLEWTRAAARKLAPSVDAGQVAATALGPALRPETRAAIAGAPDRPTQLALLLVSPEFQRR